MKTIFGIVITLMVCTALACNLTSLVPRSISGSGNVVTREFDYSDFDQVEISSAFNARVNQSQDYQVEIQLDDNFEEYLIVEKSGTTLKIGLQPTASILGNVTLEADITMPELVGLEASGSTDIDISGFKSSQALAIDLSGSSTLNGDIESGDVTFDSSGSSDAKLTGSGGKLILETSGSSSIDLSEFKVADADLDVGGSSDVTVNASGTLDVKATGSSDVTYLGSPTIGSIDTSGSSSVHPK